MNKDQVDELLYQALETEIGGVKIYKTALVCAQDEDLKEEWNKYLDQTENHVQILKELCEELGLDPDKETPGRQIVRHKGQAMVGAMEMAIRAGDSTAAQLVAAECVVDAETKDHLNWELIGKVADHLKGDEAESVRGAYETVEDEEDEHLYHTIGWTRELWLDSLGLDAVLPPPEEERGVKTAMDAARVQKERKVASKK